ncbi:MAG TPA: hypothetical protein VJN93_09255 [Candidatus Acidoferrum sp.]|nr:hypothetical protein [Candidatus Acidoferrum sp.]
MKAAKTAPMNRELANENWRMSFVCRAVLGSVVETGQVIMAKIQFSISNAC